jgi:hypothetical protein
MCNAILRNTLHVPLLSVYLNKGEFRHESFLVDWNAYSIETSGNLIVELSFDCNNPNSPPAVCFPPEMKREWEDYVYSWISKAIRSETDWFDQVEVASPSTIMMHFDNMDLVVQSGRRVAAELTVCRFGDLPRSVMEQFVMIKSSGALIVNIVWTEADVEEID